VVTEQAAFSVMVIYVVFVVCLCACLNSAMGPVVCFFVLSMGQEEGEQQAAGIHCRQAAVPTSH
jgi:hypothetical protein